MFRTSQSIVLLAALLFPAGYLAAQNPEPAAKPPRPKNRYQWMAKLRDDATAAASRASLKKAQAKSLNKSIETLRLAIEAHSNGIKFNENEIGGALKAIRKDAGDGWFVPDDRAAILDDLQHLPVREPKPKRMRPLPRIREPRRPGIRRIPY